MKQFKDDTDSKLSGRKPKNSFSNFFWEFLQKRTVAGAIFCESKETILFIEKASSDFDEAFYSNLLFVQIKFFIPYSNSDYKY